MDGAVEGDVQRKEQRAVGEREVRWSARRKEGVVMRLLRGESLDLLARETGQAAGGVSTGGGLDQRALGRPLTDGRRGSTNQQVEDHPAVLAVQ